MLKPIPNTSRPVRAGKIDPKIARALHEPGARFLILRRGEFPTPIVRPRPRPGDLGVRMPCMINPAPKTLLRRPMAAVGSGPSGPVVHVTAPRRRLRAGGCPFVHGRGRQEGLIHRPMHEKGRRPKRKAPFGPQITALFQRPDGHVMCARLALHCFSHGLDGMKQASQ